MEPSASVSQFNQLLAKMSRHQNYENVLSIRYIFADQGTLLLSWNPCFRSPFLPLHTAPQSTHSCRAVLYLMDIFCYWQYRNFEWLCSVVVNIGPNWMKVARESTKIWRLLRWSNFCCIGWQQWKWLVWFRKSLKPSLWLSYGFSVVL
jgi:hypothetical protein